MNTAFSSVKSPNPSQPEGHTTGHAIAKKSPEKVDTTKQTVIDESQPKAAPERVCGRVQEGDKTQDSESTIEYCNVTDQSDLGEGDCMQTASMQEGNQTAPQLTISYTENQDGSKSVCSNANSLVTKESVQLSPKKVISENAKKDNLERPSKQLSVKEKTKPNSKERPMSIDDKPKNPIKSSPGKCEQTNAKPDSTASAATFDAAKGVWVGGSSTSTTSHKTPKSISKSRSSGSHKESSSHRSSGKNDQSKHSQISHSSKDRDQRTKQHSSRSKSDASHHKEHSSSKKGHHSHKQEDAPCGKIDQPSHQNDIGKDLKSTNLQITGASEDHAAPVVQSSESRGKGKVVSRRGSKDEIPTQNTTKDRKEDKHKSSRSRTKSQSDGKQREKKLDKSSQSKEQDPIEEAKKVFHNFVVRRDSRSRSNSPDPQTLSKPSNCQGKETTESKKQNSTEDVSNEKISGKESEKTHNNDTQKDVTTRSSRSKTRRKTLEDSNKKSETKTGSATQSRKESKSAEKAGTSSAKSEKIKESSSSTKTSSQGKSKHSESIKQTESVLKKTPGQKIGSHRETSPAGNENLAEATQTLVKPTLSETRTGTEKKHPSSKVSEKAPKDHPTLNKLKSKEKAKSVKSSSGASKQSILVKDKKRDTKSGEERLVLSDTNNVPGSESDGILSGVKIRETAQKRTKVGEDAGGKTGSGTDKSFQNENSSPPLCKPLVSVPVDVPPGPAPSRKFVIPKLKKPAVPVSNVKKEKETSEKKDIKPVKREAPSPRPRKKHQNISTTLIKSQERKPTVNDLPTEHAPDAIVIAPIPIVSDLLQSPEVPGASEVPRDVYPPTPQNLNYTASRQGPTLTPRSFDKMISRISDQLQSPELPDASVVPRDVYPPTPQNLNYMASRPGSALTPRSFGKMISHISGELAAELPGASEVPRDIYPPTPQNLNYKASGQGPTLTPRSFDTMISHVSDQLQSPELPGAGVVPRDIYPPTPQNLNYKASGQGPTLTPRSFDTMISHVSDQLQSPELPGAGVVPRDIYPPTPQNLNYKASRPGPALTPRSFGKMISHISGELAAELPGTGEVPREAYPPTPQNLNYTAHRQGPALTPRSFDKMISHISDELSAAQVPRDPEPHRSQILVTTNQNATNQPASLDVRPLRDPRIIAAKRREHVKSVPSLMDMDLSVNAATVSKQTDTNIFQVPNNSYPSEPVDRHAHQIQNQPPAPLPPSGTRALQIPSQPNVTLPNKSMPSLMDLDVSVTAATASKQMDANTFQVPNNRYLSAAVDPGTHLIQHQPPTVMTQAGTRALQIPSQPNVALPNILQSLLGKTTEQSVLDLSTKTTESVHIETCVKENKVNDKPCEIKVETRRQVRDRAVVTTRKVNNSSAVMTDKINDSQVKGKITENEKSKPATNILEIKPTRTTYPVPKSTKVLPIATDAERLLAYASLSSRRNKELLINHKRCNRSEQKRREAKKPEQKSEHLEGETLYGGCTSGLPRVPPTPEKMLQDLTTQLSSQELEELWNQGVDVTDPEVLATFLRLRDEHAHQVVPPQHMELDDSPPRVTEWGKAYRPQYMPYPQSQTLATDVHSTPPASPSIPAPTGERQPDPSENDWSSDDEREAVNNMDNISESTEKVEVTKPCLSAKIQTSVPTDKISDQVYSVKQEAVVVDEPEKIIAKDFNAPQSENQDKVDESQPLDVPEKADGFCDAEIDSREPEDRETQPKENIEETECSQSDSQGSLEGSRSGVVTDESNSSQPMECQMEGASPNPESLIEVTEKEKTESVEVKEHKGESPSNETQSSGDQSENQERNGDCTVGSKIKITGESENEGKNVEQSFKSKTKIDSPELDCSEVSLNSGSTEPLEQRDNEMLDEHHDDRRDSVISNDSEDVKTSPLAKCPEGEVCKTVIHTPQRQDQDSEKPRRFPILQLESLREEVVVKVSISSDDVKQEDSEVTYDTEIKTVEEQGEGQEKVESDVKGEDNKTKRQELELELFGEDSIQVSMNCSDVNIKEEIPKRNTNTENESTILSSKEHFKHTKEEKKIKRQELEMELFGEDSIQVSMNCSDVNIRQEIAKPNKVTENKCTIITSKAHFKDIEEEKKTKRQELEMELFGEDSIQVSMKCSDVSFKGEIPKFDRNAQNRFNIKSEVHVNEMEQHKKNSKRQKLELELFGEDSIQVGEDSSHMSLSQRDVTSEEPLLQNTEKKINKQTSENKHDLDLDVESDLDLDVGDTEYAINPAEVQIDIDVDPSGEDTTDSSGSWIDSSLSSAETDVTIDKFVTSTADITDKPSVPERNAPTLSTFNINQMSTKIAKPPTDKTTHPDSKGDQEKVVINNDDCADREINVQEAENNKAGDDVIIEESESDGAAAKNLVGPQEVAKRKSDAVEMKNISKDTPEKDNDLNISGESPIDPVVPGEVAENKSDILGKDTIPYEKELNISGDSLIDLGDTSDANSEGACGGDEMSEDLDLTLKSDNKSGKCDEDLSDSCSSASVSGGSSLHCESNTDDDMDDLDGDFNTSSSLEKTLCPEETTIEEAKEDCSDDSPECFGDVLELHAADDPTLFDEESQQSTKVTTPKRPPKKKMCTSTPRSPKACPTPKALRTTPRKARGRSKPMQRTLSLGRRTYRNSSPKTPLKGSKEKALSAASIAVEEGEVVSDEEEELTPKSTGPSRSRHSDQRPKRRRTLSRERDGKRARVDDHRTPSGSDRRHNTSASSSSSRHSANRDKKVSPSHRDSRGRQRRSRTPDRATPSTSKQPSRRSESYSHRDTQKDSQRNTESLSRGWRRER